MKKFFLPAANIFFAAIFFVFSMNFASAEEDLHIGKGVYQFSEPTGKTSEPITIHYYRPKNWKNGDKIFVEFHGSDRHPQYFINALPKFAEKKNFLLICPEFTQKKYPHMAYYNYGHVLEKGKLTPKEQWTYNTVNRIVDDVIKRTGATKSKIIFFGHSAGGQFVHRYLFLADEIKADKIIAANAGTYLMPDENVNFPHGLKKIPVDKKILKRAYKHDLIILLGEKDIRRDSKGFPKSPAADKQGVNRLERGKNFFAQSKKKAEEIGAKFNWKLITVPNVGHGGVSMSKASMKYLD